LQLGNSEVENLQPPVGGNKEVFWFEVTMYDAAFMSRDQAL